MKPKRQNKLTIVLLVVYLLLLTGVILFKLPFYSGASMGVREINLVPFLGSLDKNGAFNAGEIIYNILVFIPLGIYIGLLKNKWPVYKKVLPVICLTLVFEITQFVFAIGRTDITDLLGNTFGGVIGIGIAALLFRIFKAKTVKIVNILALILTICVTLAFAYLLYNNHFAMVRPPVPENHRRTLPVR